MTTAELRTAAEQVSQATAWFSVDDRKLEVSVSEWEAAKKLAAGFLAEHPADDDEPVMSGGELIELDDDFYVTTAIYDIHLQSLHISQNSGDSISLKCTTRGQLRRLLAALKGE